MTVPCIWLIMVMVGISNLLMPIGQVGIIQRFVSLHTGLILIGRDTINGHPVLGRLPLYP